MVLFGLLCIFNLAILGSQCWEYYHLIDLSQVATVRHTGKPTERSSLYYPAGGNQQLARIENPANARCSGRRSELVDGLVPFCTMRNTEGPDARCSGGRSELVDGLAPLCSWRDIKSLGVGSCGRPPEPIRDGFAPTLVPSVLTARPPERSSLYHSAGRNQQSVASIANYPAGENQHRKSSGRWLQKDGGNELGNPTTRPPERSCLYDQGSASERVVTPVVCNISNGGPGRGTQASRHPNKIYYI